MSQIYSRQTAPFYPPPQGPEEEEYIDYEEYDDEGYYDEEPEDNPMLKWVLIALSGGCLLFLCMGCCILLGIGVFFLNPASLFATPLPGSDLGLVFEEPAFPDEEVVNEEAVQLRITTVNRIAELPNYTPSAGTELVIVTIELINLGSDDITYDERSFSLINQQQEAYIVSTAAAPSVEGALGTGTLAPNEGIEGRLVFEVVQGEFNLILAWAGRNAEPRYLYIE